MKRSVFFSGIFAVTALLGPGLAFECSIFPGEGPYRITVHAPDKEPKKLEYQRIHDFVD